MLKQLQVLFFAIQEPVKSEAVLLSVRLLGVDLNLIHTLFNHSFPPKLHLHQPIIVMILASGKTNKYEQDTDKCEGLKVAVSLLRKWLCLCVRRYFCAKRIQD